MKNPSFDKLNAELTTLESEHGVSEFDIRARLLGLIDRESKEQPCPEWRYEAMAFSFMENCENHDVGWGTFFGPFFVSTGDDGVVREDPSITLVDSDTIEYWKHRTGETSNPTMKARYCGLIWDLSKIAIDQRPNHEFAREYVVQVVKAADNLLVEPKVAGKNKLRHALAISLSLNDPDLVATVCDATIRYEKEIAVDEKPGLWGFSFEMLVDSPGVALDPSDEKELVDDLEARLSRIAGKDPWAFQRAAEQLIHYYKKRNQEEKVSGLVESAATEFESAAEKADAMLATSFLQNAENICRQHGDKKNAERIAKLVHEIGPKVVGEMQTISTDVEIPKDKLEKYIDELTEGDLEQFVAIVAREFVDSKDKTKEQVLDHAKNNPLTYLISHQLFDHDGRHLATIGSVEEDLDGRIVRQITENTAFSSIILNAAWHRAIEKYEISAESLLQVLSLSPAYREDHQDMLRRSLQLYLDGDFVGFAHLAVPQIESAVRELVGACGGVIIYPRKDGSGYQYVTLNGLLESAEFARLFGEDTAYYLRVLLTDHRGWNIRNEICHGLLPHSQFGKDMANRLLHILCLLAQARLKEKTDGPTDR